MNLLLISAYQRGQKNIKLIGNFEYEKEYNLIVRKGLQSILGEELEKDFNLTLKLEDFQPKVEYINNGVFLPSSSNSKLYFRAINILNANIEVSKIHDNNIFYYLQDYDLIGNRSSGQDAGYQFYRIGEVVYSEKIDLLQETNKWNQYELDLSKYSMKTVVVYIL